MDKRQKKILLISITIVGIIASLGLSLAILIFNVKDWTGTKENIENLLNWFFVNFGSMTLGLILKILVNKKHKKDIKKIVNNEGGDDMLLKKKEELIFKGFKFTITKAGLLIEDTLNRGEIDKVNSLTGAVLEYTEYLRNKVE